MHANKIYSYHYRWVLFYHNNNYSWLAIFTRLNQKYNIINAFKLTYKNKFSKWRHNYVFLQCNCAKSKKDCFGKRITHHHRLFKRLSILKQIIYILNVTTGRFAWLTRSSLILPLKKCANPFRPWVLIPIKSASILLENFKIPFSTLVSL